MFGHNAFAPRRRLGCWFYVAVIAIVLNPLVWRLVLALLQPLLQYFAVHLASWSFL